MKKEKRNQKKKISWSKNVQLKLKEIKNERGIKKQNQEANAKERIKKKTMVKKEMSKNWDKRTDGKINNLFVW